ncbi:MAG: 3'(2'),5'-bisphosphate nucleotidase CysQ [Pseudomonadota bacterium]
MPETDLPLLIDAARAAGRIALQHFAGDRKATEKPGDLGPVTAADLAVDQFLREKLLSARPDYGWLSEETEDDASRLNADRVFVVDPIDGTRAFIDGGRAWSHSIAVVERGRSIAAVVYLPRLETIYSAFLGGGAHKDGYPIHSSRQDHLNGAKFLLNATQLNPKYWPGGVPPVERHFRSSIAYRLCLAGEGRFEGMLTFRDTWEWDVAAGALIASEAGAVVTDRDGGEILLNNREPSLAGIIAAPQPLHGAILSRIAPAA